MNILKINDDTFHIPEGWADLSETQRIEVWKILNDDLNNHVDPTEELSFIQFRILIAITEITFDYLFALRQIDEEEWVIYTSIILNHVSWMFEVTEDGQSIASNMFVNPVPSPIDIEGVQYIGPDDEMDNVKFGELVAVFTKIENLDPDHPEETADELWSILWRPLAPDATDDSFDKRISYVGLEHLAAKRKLLAGQIPSHIKDFIMYWAQCIRKKYADAFENLFKAAKVEGERSGNDYAWSGVIMSLAHDVTKIPEVQNQGAEDVFVYLSFLEDERLKAEMAANKK